MTREASYEEVQDARNFLCEQYAAHAPSREAIELALDDILQASDASRRPLAQRGKDAAVVDLAAPASLRRSEPQLVPQLHPLLRTGTA